MCQFRLHLSNFFVETDQPELWADEVDFFVDLSPNGQTTNFKLVCPISLWNSYCSIPNQDFWISLEEE
jgi:hypothetical protein